MSQSHKTLIDFLEKAYDLTTQGLKLAQNQEFDKLINVLDNRERAIAIAETMSERMSLEQMNQDPKQVEKINNQVNQLIRKITTIDEMITMYLQEEKNKTQNEIAKTFKNKENLRGYNLNKID